jgi:DNA helicase-2/ATP-dependent DNA helicase PcrA
VVLTSNYRSNQKILDTSYTLIKYNNPDRLEVKNDINKRLISERDALSRPAESAGVTHFHFDTVSQEADFVAEKIVSSVKTGKKFNNFAVLVRSNNDADPFIKAMNAKSVPWRFSGGSGLYGRAEIKVLISFLRAVSNLSDSVSLFHLASSEIYGMPMADLTALLNEASKKRVPLYTVCRAATAEGMTAAGGETLARLLGDMKKYMELSRELSTGQVLYRFVSDTGWLKKLTEETEQRGVEKV